jgi:hypothetical protein
LPPAFRPTCPSANGPSTLPSVEAYLQTELRSASRFSPADLDSDVHHPGELVGDDFCDGADAGDEQGAPGAYQMELGSNGAAQVELERLERAGP